jgi:putative transposase
MILSISTINSAKTKSLRTLLERDGFSLNRRGFPNRSFSDSPCWLEWRPGWMGRPYSRDLRERVVTAVLESGLSRRKAASQFAVGISTVINWVRRFRETGSILPGQMGGHKPKAIVGEHRARLLFRIKENDFTLRGLVTELAQRGLKVDYKTVWNFVHTEKLSFKKNRARQRARSPGRRASA